MVVVACLEAVALVLIAWILIRDGGKREAEWATERRELLNRIQRPDRLPVESAPEFIAPEFEPDEFDLVGTIQEPLKEER